MGLQGLGQMKEREGPTSVAHKHRRQPVMRCSGQTFVDVLIAGTYFLRKYRSVVNDLNVFPVPDGDTGTNMFLTVRAGMLAARLVRNDDLAAVTAAAAQGSLMGARGNSGVIMSQMFRGFAHATRHRQSIETRDLARALNDAVHAARQSLLKPVEGTILSVASAAAAAAFKAGLDEPDFYPVLNAVVVAANEALEKTPEQLPVLKEANVVDAGGQGFVYFLEGALRMLPGRQPYDTAFPRRSERRGTFTARQRVQERRFCTEFVLASKTISAHKLRDILSQHGDSLIVARGAGALRVHIHSDYPDRVMDIAREFGDVSRTKVDNMEDQHNVLLVGREAKPRGIVCVVPGDGFAQICKELGADVTVLGGATMNPSVRDLVLAVNKVLAPVVYLFPNDKNIIAAAQEVKALAERQIVVVPTRSVPEGIAALLALSNHSQGEKPDPQTLTGGSDLVASGSIFRAGRDATFGGVAIKHGELMGALDARDGKAAMLVKGADAAGIASALIVGAGAEDASLVTLYYGSVRKLEEAEAVAEALRAVYPKTAVEVYYGGQRSSDYLISIER
jgi:uncharacterized protein